MCIRDSFHVYLWWVRDREMQLESLQNEPRVFKHFGRFLKWAAQHEITTVDLEEFKLTDELKALLLKQGSDLDDDEERAPRSKSRTAAD